MNNQTKNQTSAHPLDRGNANCRIESRLSGKEVAWITLSHEGKMNSIGSTYTCSAYTCSAGTRIVVPPRSVHSELSGSANALVGLSMDPATLSENVDLPPSALV
ncbi:MAG TPA: hypothetical protein DIT58_12200 [Porticoccaceae bacterium]|nr:hypothetical protein [Porticoccaceae bacterium]